MKNLIDKLFVYIYYGLKAPGKKLRYNRRDTAIRFFTAFTSFYSILLFWTILFCFLKLHFPKNTSEYLYAIIMAVIYVICNYFIKKRYTNARIDLLDEEYEGTISVGKAQIIYYSMLMSIPVVVLFLIIKLVK